ncbi:MAG: hypothetical protein ACRESS_06110 [Stenotrophobium sp.]
MPCLEILLGAYGPGLAGLGNNLDGLGIPAVRYTTNGVASTLPTALPASMWF